MCFFLKIVVNRHYIVQYGNCSYFFVLDISELMVIIRKFAGGALIKSPWTFDWKSLDIFKKSLDFSSKVLGLILKVLGLLNIHYRKCRNEGE